MLSKNCPLCFSENSNHFFRQEKLSRDFYRCDFCDLVFVDRGQLVTQADEKKRYQLHDNSTRSPGYEKFLLRLVAAVDKHVDKAARGLDFGEGPYPMLRELLKENGYLNVLGFDPLFNNQDLGTLGSFQFITCCEVIEHMNKPAQQIEALVKLLNTEGLLVISTGITEKGIKFENWHYLNDETHINLFSDKTFAYLAEIYNLEILQRERDLIAFLKK